MFLLSDLRVMSLRYSEWVARRWYYMFRVTLLLQFFL